MKSEKDKRIISSKEYDNDKTLDLSLRPKFLDEYIGQEKIKENLRIFIKAAQQRSEPVEHILLHGSHGLGKTTLAFIIANETNSNIKITSGPAIEKAGDLAAILTNLNQGDVLFIDEIHRLNTTIEEMLYPAMEDFALDIIIGKGPGARNLRIDLPHFTLISATTKASLISSPLRDRFGIVYHLNFYEQSDIEKIIKRSANILKTQINEDACSYIAKRSRRTPRVANRLLKRVRDFAQVKGNGKISLDFAKRALDMLEIDDFGLDWLDRKILEVIIDKFNGGPVGLKTIAVSVGEEMATIEDVYEPFLLRTGFINRTSRGRVATRLAYEHLGRNYIL